MKDKLVNVKFKCPMCGTEHYLKISQSKLDRVLNRYKSGEYIQDILSDLSPKDREKFITEYCDDCQKRLFGE